MHFFELDRGRGSAKVSEWAAKDSECRRKNEGGEIVLGKTEKKKEKTRQTPAMCVCSTGGGAGLQGRWKCWSVPSSPPLLAITLGTPSVCLFGWMQLGRPTEENFSLSFSFAFFPPVAFGSPI